MGLVYLHTWNPNDPCFHWKRPCFGGLTFKNRGHLGSRYIYFYFLMVNAGTYMIHGSFGNQGNLCPNYIYGRSLACVFQLFASGLYHQKPQKNCTQHGKSSTSSWATIETTCILTLHSAFASFTRFSQVFFLGGQPQTKGVYLICARV